MINKFYIDESGSTGDLIVTKENLNFSSQEYFTLACVGIDNDLSNSLENKIIKLKKSYKIQSKDLKFGKIKHIFGKKIGFILELYNLLEENSNFLIEIVDKKYIIATNIVSCLINPPYFQPQDIKIEYEKKLHLIFAQWVYDNVDNEFFINFSSIAKNPSQKGLETLFSKLLEIGENFNDDISISVVGNIKESIDDYEIMRKKNTSRAAHTYFLPLPDFNKRGELIGMLPHIASFTNIHARLNYIFSDLSLVTIIHDNHAHFDEIIKEYHNAGKTEEIPVFEKADFNFVSISNLEFKDDKNEIGLQIADIFAGFINKAIPYIVKQETYLEDYEYRILLQVLVSLYYQKNINFVLPDTVCSNLLFPFLDNIVKFHMQMSTLGISKEIIDNDLLKKIK